MILPSPPFALQAQVTRMLRRAESKPRTLFQDLQTGCMEQGSDHSLKGPYSRYG